MDAIEFRGVPIASLTAPELTAVVLDAAAARRGLKISFVNPHSFNLMRRDRSDAYLADLRTMDVVAADGIGVVLLVRLLLGRRISRLSFDLWAPDLFENLARSGARVFLLGARPGVADRAAAALVRQHPHLSIVGTHHGHLRPDGLPAVLRSVRHAGAEVVIVGAGAPLQERLAVLLSDAETSLIAATCGGYLDQVTAPSTYYPRWAYPLRLNWLVRLYREPRRLWRRYLLGTPEFVFDSLLWRLRRPSL